MKAIGLQPTSTGEPGGKETGQNMTHMIVAGGRYAAAYAKLKIGAFELRWQSASQDRGQAAKSRLASKASKTKFTCPECGQNAWAKADAMLICGDCYEEGDGDTCFMLA